jgi:GxxExxY protein
MNKEMLLDEGKGERGKGNSGESGLTSAIIGAAIEVHRSLGPGFLAAIYEEAFCVELEHCGLAFERQKAVPVFYRERLVGEHRLDLLVERQVVVELKSIKTIELIHFAIVRSYLKALDLRLALLLNFASAPRTIRRIDRDHPPKDTL